MRHSLPFLMLSLSLPLALAGCRDVDLYFNITNVSSGGSGGGGGDAGGSGGSGGSGGGATGGQEPFLEGAPTPDTAVADLDIDLFGKDGNRFWFAVDPKQVAKMNGGDVGGFIDIYTPGGEDSANYVNHLFATTAGDAPATADYGKVEVRVVGQSTYRPWKADTIANLSVDMDQFQDGLRLDGTERFRFNNGLVGGIFREEIAHDIYNALGYAAPRSAFAWVGSNVWGPDIQIPYTVVEVYKKAFCEQRAEQLGGDCVNIWDFQGDLANGPLDPAHCQIKACDNTRLEELVDLLAVTPHSAGYKEATKDYIAWDKLHEFQCLGWMLWTGDDFVHHMNNVLLVERDDGRFLFLPYSVDISAGHEWYQDTPLAGTADVAMGCQSDPACWADLLATCDTLVTKFQALDTPALVDTAYDRLKDNGMLRPGDEDRYEQIRDWYEKRAADLPGELIEQQEPPCQAPMVKCMGQCIPVDQCDPMCDPVTEVQCGAVCTAPGACIDCQWPFFFCFDGSCQATCPF